MCLLCFTHSRKGFPGAHSHARCDCHLRNLRLRDCVASHTSSHIGLLTRAICADRAFCATQTTARLLINGEFKESQTDTWIDVTNPVRCAFSWVLCPCYPS